SARAIGEPGRDPSAGRRGRALRARLRDTLRLSAGRNSAQSFDGAGYRLGIAEGKTTAAPAQPDAAAGDPGALGNTANALSTGASTGPLLAPRVIDPRNDFLI